MSLANPTKLVEEYVNTAYDNVKKVSDDIASVIATANAIDSVISVAGNLDKHQSSLTAPTTRSNGDPLTAGDTYFNLSNTLLYEWSGSVWIDNSPATAVIAAAAALVSETAAAASAVAAAAVAGKQVASMTALLAVDTGVTTSASLISFHPGLDSGGGEFYYDATVSRTLHNGGTIIDPTNAANLTLWDAAAKATWFTPGSGLGCWIRIYSGDIDVRMAGFKGGGVEDDYKSIQESLNLASTNGGRTVTIPNVSGGFKTGTKITVPSNVRLKGASPAEFTVSGANPSAVVMKPTSAVSVGIELLDTTSSYVESIAIDCTNVGTTFTGFVFDGIQHSGFKNLSCVEMSLAGHTGFSIKETNRGCYWNNAENCKARGFPADLGTGFKIQGNSGLPERVTQWTFLNCNAFDMWDGWVMDYIGAGMTLINCTGEQCGNDGLVVTNIAYGGAPNIVGGEFSNNAGYGVNGLCMLINTALSGNTSGATTNGAYRQFVDNTSGNYLHQQYGVHAWDTSVRVLEKTISAATETINSALYGIVEVVGNAAYTLTSTPTIEAGTREGQLLTITARFPGVNTITIQDDGTLTGSGLYLKGGGTLTLSSLVSVYFRWRAADSKWYEIGRN
jgi:hypothetical protein